MTDAKVIFGGLLVGILLGIYVYLVWIAVSVVSCVAQPSCHEFTIQSFTPPMASTLSLIGGLVSALVIAELAITKPGKAPAERILGPNVSAAERVILGAVVLLYLAAWTISGLVAFIVGYLHHSGVLQSLTDLGQSWIGIAIAAGYAYFGIQPPEGKGRGGDSLRPA